MARQFQNIGRRDTRVLLVTLVILAAVLVTANISWPFDDFIEYWAAGRLNAVGQNPYDASELLRIEKEVGWTDSVAVMMYNPPWALAVAMPASAVAC